MTVWVGDMLYVPIWWIAVPIIIIIIVVVVIIVVIAMMKEPRVGIPVLTILPDTDLIPLKVKEIANFAHPIPNLEVRWCMDVFGVAPISDSSHRRIIIIIIMTITISVSIVATLIGKVTVTVIIPIRVHGLRWDFRKNIWFDYI